MKETTKKYIKEQSKDAEGTPFTFKVYAVYNHTFYTKTFTVKGTNVKEARINLVKLWTGDYGKIDRIEALD